LSRRKISLSHAAIFGWHSRWSLCMR
jgi:hypothetical protein